MKKKLPLVIGFGGFYQPYLFKKSLFTPYTVEQLLQGIELQEKEEKGMKSIEESCLERTQI